MHNLNKLPLLNQLFILIFTATLITSCAPRLENHGSKLDKYKLTKIVAGSTKKKQVLSILGPPSTKTAFGAESWIYIATNTKTTVFFNEQVISRKITKISFNKNNIVTEVTKFTEKDQNTITHLIRETPTAGQEITLIQQFLGNIGKFNTNSLE